MLDEALDSLDDDDREALLLRYFKNQDFRAVGYALGVSNDTAQKRVSRAVDRLREFFAKRGVTVGAGGLVVVVSANAVQTAPVGLAATISAAAFAETSVTTTTIIAATAKTIAMTTLQKNLITATLAVVAGAGFYEAKQAARLQQQNQALQQQQAALAGQIQQLQNSFADATNRLAGILAENARLKSNANENELLKLRGEVTVLENKLNSAKQSGPSPKSDARGFTYINWGNVPAVKILDIYTNIAKVELVGAENASHARFGVTLRTNGVSVDQLKQIIEQALLEQSGIILTQLDQHRVSVTYDDQLELIHLETNLPPTLVLTANDVVSNSVRVTTSPSNPVQNLVLRLVGKTSDQIKAIQGKNPEVRIMKDGVFVVKSEAPGLLAKKGAGKETYTGLVLIFSKYEDAKLAEKVLRGN